MTGVSVIMPTVNMGRFLPDAVASIARQGCTVAEIVMVDSASVDGTPDIIAQLRKDGAPIRMIESDAQAPSVARNEGIAAARGDVIAFLDADDLWPQGKLARQLGYLQAFPGKGMVTGFVRYFDVLDRARLAPAEDSRIETLFHVHVGACVYRRAVFERIGTFDETLLYSEDVDLLLRVREVGIDFTILRAIMLYYRKHPNSMMAQKNPRRSADFRRAVALSMARRRARGLPPIDLDRFESFIEAVP
jgi:glycosyltransferase involved in cell wall biosynthesis